MATTRNTVMLCWVTAITLAGCVPGGISLAGTKYWNDDKLNEQKSRGPDNSNPSNNRV